MNDPASSARRRCRRQSIQRPRRQVRNPSPGRSSAWSQATSRLCQPQLPRWVRAVPARSPKASAERSVTSRCPPLPRPARRAPARPRLPRPGIPTSVRPGIYGKYRAESQALIAATIAAQRAIGIGEYLALEQDRVRFMHEFNALFADKADLRRRARDDRRRSNTQGAGRADVLAGSVPGDVSWATPRALPRCVHPPGAPQRPVCPSRSARGLPWQETESAPNSDRLPGGLSVLDRGATAAQVPRTLTAAEVVTPPTSSTTDPTGTVATRRQLRSCRRCR